MIRISPGDLVGVRANDRYYYALVLDRVRLFGGNWVFVFHRSSEDLLNAVDVLTGPVSGFNAFVDFIWAKRDSPRKAGSRQERALPFGTVCTSTSLSNSSPRRN